METVMDVVDRVTLGIVTKQEKAIILRNYVRDNIKFGFNRYFDA